MKLLHEDITGEIIKAFYKVHNVLGYGFLEKIYENAMMIELRKQGLSAKKQEPIIVYYDGQIVGDYRADILVEDTVILELKAVKEIIEKHEVQLVNYLKATEIEVGLLLNFGETPQVKRKIFHNEFK
ncbi:MAG: GxxExxY protein [Bacteroidota bacterium]